MLDAKKIKDLQIVGLLTKVIELASSEPETFYQQLVSTSYAQLSAIKEHLQGDAWQGDENIAAKYDLTDDDDDGAAETN